MLLYLTGEFCPLEINDLYQSKLHFVFLINILTYTHTLGQYLQLMTMWSVNGEQ